MDFVRNVVNLAMDTSRHAQQSPVVVVKVAVVLSVVVEALGQQRDHVEES